MHRIQSSGRFHTLSFSGNPDDLFRYSQAITNSRDNRRRRHRQEFISRALGVQACNEGYRTRIFYLRELLKDMAFRDRAGTDSYAKRLRMLSNVPLLIIDEWFSVAPSKDELVILHELVDSRYGRRSTVICSQMPSGNWAGYCSNRALGESITGRIMSKVYEINLQGTDMRKAHFERP